jgi:hypothetical protein
MVALSEDRERQRWKERSAFGRKTNMIWFIPIIIFTLFP